MSDEASQSRSLHREFVVEGGVSQGDFDFLSAACGDDPDLERLRRMLRRRQLGEPREYVASPSTSGSTSPTRN